MSPGKKRKYISESETQCDDEIYENSQSYDDWEPEGNKYSGFIKKTTQNSATCSEKKRKIILQIQKTPKK